MKVELNILERVSIMNMLPQKGSLACCRASSNTAKILMITPEEITEHNVRVEGGQTHWDPSGLKGKEFEIPDSSVKVIRNLLSEYDKSQIVTVDMVTLYDKFYPQCDGNTADIPEKSYKEDPPT